MSQRGSNGAGNPDGGNRRAGAFLDPFAGFGGFGFGNNMFPDFFGRDPFDDPFFRSPFGNFPGRMFGPRHEGGFLESQPHQESGRRGPIIEEVEGDHHHSGSRRQEPIVEHPDDESRPGRNRSSGSSRSLRGQGPGGGFMQSYSFQSSSFSSGGPNGEFYASSTARRAGPNGVVLEEHYEKDSSSKTESHRVSKGIQDKGHSVTRKRNAEGREENLETLHNLEEAEVSEFDRRWESEADRNLPGWNRNRARALDGHSGGGSRQRAALPNSSGARNA